MEHHQTVERPKMAPQVDGQLFGVRLPIFNFKSSKFSISINFTNPLRKTFYIQIYPKITKKFTKQPRTEICGMSEEILDCLKRKRDICVKIIIPSQNIAFR